VRRACAGVYNDPIIPSVPGDDSFPGVVVHSSRYTNATDLGLVGKKVLVVGFGNSGAEISLDLVEHGATPLIVARSPSPIVPRRFIQLLQSFQHRFLVPFLRIPFAWLTLPTVLLTADCIGKAMTRLKWGRIERFGLKLTLPGPIVNFLTQFQPPLMDVGTLDAVRAGRAEITPHGIAKIEKDTVVFSDGSRQQVSGIVWATGYQVLSGHDHILDETLAKQLSRGKRAITRVTNRP